MPTEIASALVLVSLAVVVCGAGLTLVHWLLIVREVGSFRPVTRQLVMLALTLLAAFAAVFVLSLVSQTRETAAILVGLLGLALSVAMTVSSTTFISNAMAGLMLRAVRNFQTGDFVRVGDYFGRVTERGLFHVEIQTEDRDLATIPNMFLVSQPVKVVRASGTIVSAELSLGYDVPHHQVESLLQDAAMAAGLEKPFVHLMDLGNFAITYRVAGFLPTVDQLLSVRSTLRSRVLDTLHGAGIEIVSPTFMNQRPLPAQARVVPDGTPNQISNAAADDPPPEAMMFDKADEEKRLEALRTEQVTLAEQIKALDGQGSSDLVGLQQRMDAIDALLRTAAEVGRDTDD